VPAFDYPAAPGMSEFAELLLRTVSADAQDSLRLAAADSVRYAVYDADGYQVLYALNTEFEVSQSVRVCLDGKMTGEFIIPPSSMAFFAVRNGLVLHPQHIETAIEAWTDDTCKFASPFEQDVAFWNLADAPCKLAINGQPASVPASGKALFHLLRTQGAIPDEFFAEDYLEEPDIDVTNCTLPY